MSKRQYQAGKVLLRVNDLRKYMNTNGEVELRDANMYYHHRERERERIKVSYL